jgi:hypothetical protein
MECVCVCLKNKRTGWTGVQQGEGRGSWGNGAVQDVYIHVFRDKNVHLKRYKMLWAQKKESKLEGILEGRFEG